MNDQEKLRLKELQGKPVSNLAAKELWQLQHLIMLELLTIPGVKGG